MIALLFSTEDEAAPFLRKYERGRFDGLSAEEALYDDRLLVTITGSGLIKTTLNTERVLRHFNGSLPLARIIHAGTCTAFTETPAPGTVTGVSQVLEGDRIEMAAPNYPRMPLDVPFEGMPSITLVSQNHLPDEDASRTYWSRIAQASDTAGYAIAFVAATHGLPCHLVKAVAGRFGASDRDVRQTREQAHNALADTLLRILASFAP